MQKILFTYNIQVVSDHELHRSNKIWIFVWRILTSAQCSICWMVSTEHWQFLCHLCFSPEFDSVFQSCVWKHSFSCSLSLFILKWRIKCIQSIKFWRKIFKNIFLERKNPCQKRCGIIFFFRFKLWPSNLTNIINLISTDRKLDFLSLATKISSLAALVQKLQH